MESFPVLCLLSYKKCFPLRRGCSSCGQPGFAQSEPISLYIAVGGHTAVRGMRTDDGEETGLRATN